MAKMSMPDLQWYSWNVVFSLEKCYFLIGLHCFLQARNAQVSYAEKTHMKIKSYKNKTRISNRTNVIRAFHICIECYLK